MNGFEKYTAYPPMQTTITTTSWIGWRPMSLRCLKCVHYAFVPGMPSCQCVSRTVKHSAQGDECVSYFEKEERK